MDPKTIKYKIEKEIGDRWSETNWHGLDLKKCLVEPRLVSVRNTFPVYRPKPRILNLWLVLEEFPERKKGYLILFNHDRDVFGLGKWSEEDEIYLVGYYGSFWSTFMGM